MVLKQNRKHFPRNYKKEKERILSTRYTKLLQNQFCKCVFTTYNKNFSLDQYFFKSELQCHKCDCDITHYYMTILRISHDNIYTKTRT